MSTNSGSASLRPAWKGGRGFQPPPTVTSDTTTRGRSSSVGTNDAGTSKRDSNKFSALQDDDDFISVGGKKSRDRAGDRNLSSSSNNNNSSSNGGNGDGDPKQNSRSEAFRSSFGSRREPKPGGGRSLADLAARVPEGMARSASTGYAPEGRSAAGPGGRRFSDLSGRSTSVGGVDEVEGMPKRVEVSAYKQAVDSAKVIRYTREKLLALRPRPQMDAEYPPPYLENVDSVLLAEKPQDPVCWDTFDADEIWATVPNRRPSAPLPKPAVREEVVPGERRRSYNAPSSGRWQRGVALPPTEERRSGKDKDANSPDDLWDDPVGGATGAAMDFSAFGGMPEGDLAGGDGASAVSDDAFDFEKMAEATRKFEEELHGSKNSEDFETEEEINAHSIKVDPKRPLATVGTTIRSGSGDDVNVFEDFDAPSEGDDMGEQPATEGEVEPIKSGGEDPSASSRLMAMIGVKKDESLPPLRKDSGSMDDDPKVSPWNGGTRSGEAPGLLGLGGPAGSSTAIPLNPWGDPIIAAAPQPTQQNVGLGMDLASRLESFAAEQKAREAAELEQKELLLRRQEQEEAQRRALAQQQAQERARQQAQQQAMQQQQQPSPQAQVEAVLMERITTILENSWGRSDLVSILSTLHAEDSRVIPLLSNVDLLRDLIAHNPRRVALRQDPAFGTEMAVLQMTNAQWQQHEAQVRAQQQEELRRREEQLRMQDIQRQRSLSYDGPPMINPDAPWFYSDPQGNIQGPFRGDEMRQWLEAGYFKGDLPISQQANGPFIALSAIFPDLSVAFTPPQNDRAKEEAETRARAEEEQRMFEERRRAEQLEMERQRQAAEQQARKEQEAREAAERERLEREAAAAAAQAEAQAQALSAAEASNGANQSSAQLKMMLGLSSHEEHAPIVESDAYQHAEQPKAVEKPTDKRQSKVETMNNYNQKRFKEPASAPQAPPQPAKPAAPAWGGAAQSTTTTRKSMSEIQKEEARRAAALAMQQGNQPRQSGSGWANIAAAGTGAWTPGTVKPTAAAVVGGGSAATTSGARAGTTQTAARPKAAQQQPAAGARKSSPQQRSSSTSNTAAEEFGASMSPALEKWCKDQMKKLNGTDDLTLVSFCMTLDDAVEIRQYLTTYLGSTPQVNNFATEFINKKGGGAPKTEEWETPGSAKKGRKKKGAR